MRAGGGRAAAWEAGGRLAEGPQFTSPASDPGLLPSLALQPRAGAAVEHPNLGFLQHLFLAPRKRPRCAELHMRPNPARVLCPRAAEGLGGGAAACSRRSPPGGCSEVGALQQTKPHQPAGLKITLQKRERGEKRWLFLTRSAAALASGIGLQAACTATAGETWLHPLAPTPELSSQWDPAAPAPRSRSPAPPMLPGKRISAWRGRALLGAWRPSASGGGAFLLPSPLSHPHLC